MSKIFSVDFRAGSPQDKYGAIATLGATAKIDRDIKGYALKCKSLSTDYITYGDVSSINSIGTGEFTIVVGFNTKLFLNHGSVDNVLFSKTANSSTNGFSFFYQTNNRLLFTLLNSLLSNPIATILYTDNIAICTRNSSGLCTLYFNGIAVSSVTQSGNISSAGSLSIGTDVNTSRTPNASIYLSEVYNNCLTQLEINKLTEEFNNARTLAKQKRGIVKQRINDLSMFKGTGAGQGLIFASNMQPKGNTLVDISGNGYNMIAESNSFFKTKNGLTSVRTDTLDRFSTTGFILNTWSVTLSFNKLIVTNTSMAIIGNSSVNAGIFLSRVTKNVLTYRSNSGTFYYWDGSGNTIDMPSSSYAYGENTIILISNNINIYAYLNGISYGYITPTTTSLNFKQIFNAYGSPANGTKLNLKDLKVYNRILSLSEIKQYHNSFVLPTFTETFENEGADGSARVPTGWIKGTGSYCIKQITTDVISGGLRLLKGQKYLENLSAGTISFPNNWVNGAVEFSWYKGSDANILEFNFTNMTSNITGGAGGYKFQVYSDESIRLTKTGLAVLIQSTLPYIQNFIWYTTRIERTNAGQFTLLIKGGNFIPTSGRNGFTLVSTTGGSGNNPTIDATYNSSSYSVLSCGIGDRITNIKFIDGIPQL